MGRLLGVGDFVVCQTDNGYPYKNGKRRPTRTYFPENSVGLVRELYDNESRIYVIGKNTEYFLLNEALSYLDVLKTGKGHPRKICNICHVLKVHNEFERNQSDAKGRPTSRPSCKDCRKLIDGKPMKPADRKEAKKGEPSVGTLWECPICEKTSIVGVTAKVVLDHDKVEGKPRDFLCDSCNTGLGRFKNGGNYLKNAIAYLEDHSSRQGSG